MTIELRTDPSSYRHWHLAVDGPVATLTMRVTPDAGLRESMGRAARQTASRYEWDAVNASFAAEIERVAGERQ